MTKDATHRIVHIQVRVSPPAVQIIIRGLVPQADILHMLLSVSSNDAGKYDGRPSIVRIVISTVLLPTWPDNSRVWPLDKVMVVLEFTLLSGGLSPGSVGLSVSDTVHCHVCVSPSLIQVSVRGSLSQCEISQNSRSSLSKVIK